MMKSKTIFIVVVCTIALKASTQEYGGVDVDNTDLLLEQSMERMQKLSQVSKKVDNVVKTTIVEMKETIETLEEENEALVEQVEEAQAELKEIKDEVDSYRSPANNKPFNLLPILSDTTGGGK